jgi:ribosomal protein L25 (general stress protein Ctc)
VGQAQKRVTIRLRRHVKEKMFTKCTTAYLLEANVASLSMKQASYIIIVVYPFGGMQKFGSYQESSVDFFFYKQSTNQIAILSSHK